MINKFFSKSKADRYEKQQSYKKSFQYIYNFIKDQMEYQEHGTVDIGFLNPTEEILLQLTKEGFTIDDFNISW